MGWTARRGLDERYLVRAESLSRQLAQIQGELTEASERLDIAKEYEAARKQLTDGEGVALSSNWYGPTSILTVNPGDNVQWLSATSCSTSNVNYYLAPKVITPREWLDDQLYSVAKRAKL